MPSLASHARRGEEDKKEPFVHYQKLIFPVDERQKGGKILLATSPPPTELFIVTALNSWALEGKREIATEETAKVSLLAH